MTIAQETAKLVASLPPAKAEAVLDFARYMAQRDDQEAWEQVVKKAGRSGRLKAFLEEAKGDIVAGKSEPFNSHKL